MVIELVVGFLTEFDYHVTNAPQFRLAENAYQINKSLTGKQVTNEKILIHYGVFDLAEYMGIPELVVRALGMIEYILTRRSRPLSIEVFQELIGKIWEPKYGETPVQVSQQRLALRRIAVTFGVIMEPLWAVQDNKRFTELTAPEGQYKEYAKWHAETAAAIRVQSEYMTPICVRKMMEEAKMKAREPSRNIDSVGGTLGGYTSDAMEE